MRLHDREAVLHRAARPTVELITRLAEDQPRFVRSMLAEIAQHFFEPGYSVADLKSALRLHSRDAARFRRRLGLTPGQLILECRMETGLRLLRDTLLPVEEIAFLIGYDSVRAFEKKCRGFYGRSPAKIRELLRAARDALVPDAAFGWHFEERLLRRELAKDEVLPVLEYLKRLYLKP